EMKELLGEKYYPYFSGAIAQILVARYFQLQIACSIVALFHLLAERLYFGKSPKSFWVTLLMALFAFSLLGSCWLQPKLRAWHTTKYAINAKAEERAAASQSFRIWHGVAQAVNLLMMGGLAVYLWRLANPPDSTRFVSTAKF